MTVKNFRDLIAWQKAMDLVERIYAASQAFPREEVYGLTSQLRRSAISVPSNIAEGEGRTSPKDFLNFLSIAHGSLRELETQIEIARRLQYIPASSVGDILDLSSEVGRLINGLMRSIGANIIS